MAWVGGLDRLVWRWGWMGCGDEMGQRLGNGAGVSHVAKGARRAGGGESRRVAGVAKLWCFLLLSLFLTRMTVWACRLLCLLFLLGLGGRCDWEIEHFSVVCQQ